VVHHVRVFRERATEIGARAEVAARAREDDAADGWVVVRGGERRGELVDDATPDG
jgi:hypothetical protein